MIFDNLVGSSWDDPKTLAALAAARALLGRGGTMQRITDAGLGYGGALDAQANRNALRERANAETLLMQMRVQELQRQQAAQAEEAKRAQAVQQAYGTALVRDMPQMDLGDPEAVVPQGPVRFDKSRFIEELAKVAPAEAAKLLMPQPGKRVTLKPGESVFDESSGQRLFGLDPAPEKDPTSVEEYNFARTHDGYRGTYEQWVKEKLAASAPKTVVDMTGGQKGFDNESKLRSDFRAEPIYKEFQDTRSAYKQIKEALRQGTPIGDTAAATKIMKLLDPGSVVRESELAMSMQATGRLDRLRNYVQMQISGQKLTPQQRTEFGLLADDFYHAAEQAYNQKRMEYEQLAKDYGLNATRALGPAPSNVVDFSTLK